MNILIPMAGAGQRFSDAGYKMHKPAIPTIDRHCGETKPMVVCATNDLPGVLLDGQNVIYIERDFHKADGVEAEILRYFPAARFISVDCLTEGQACTCLLAKKLINNDEPLLIAGCDNGMVFSKTKFEADMSDTDVLVFTYRKNDCVLKNPNAYGWMVADDNGVISSVSIKKAISDNPINDHAVVATFWFKTGKTFVTAAEKMINENDRINGEFYVDQVVHHVLDMGLRAKVFEIERYIGWGTPQDFESYTKTYLYWRKFYLSEKYLGG